MSLSAGDHLGHYRVLAALGAGGMGQVFLARDTKLNRDVAIKVVSDGFTSDPDRLARFQREAQTLAALNHPHIAQIYGIEDSGDVHALVMELVVGEDLARRLARGKLPLPEALRLAQQIAEAVEAAHEKGIVHRDLKPSNIMVDSNGRARVLDFGLATAPESFDPSDSSSAATITSPAKLTGRGVVVGTPAYMSPEQITGQPADKRCDVWAFGCVLYEMLTGRRTFDGRDTHDAMMAVTGKEPEWSALGPDVPEPVRKLLKRCLEKVRRHRLADMSVVRLELEDALETGNAAAASPAITRGRAPRLPLAAISIGVASVATLLILWVPWRRTPPRELILTVADLGAPVSLATSQGASTILSPDGRTLLFSAQSRTGGALPRLYTRQLDALAVTTLPGTDGAMNPFFSPDGHSLGFFASGKLKKMALSGGPAVEVAEAPNGRGGSWGDDDHIVFMPDFYAGLWRVPAAGGDAVQLTHPANRTGTHRWPQVLPGSRAVLYTSNPSVTAYENAEIVLQPLPSGAPRVILKGGMHGQFMASGHLVFMRQGALFATGFDLERLERTGEPVPIIDDLAGSPFWTGAAQFAASTEGTAVYVAGKSLAAPVNLVVEGGLTSSLSADAMNWSDPSFSADGRRLAVDIFDGKQADIWTYDLAASTWSRLTHDPHVDAKPVWSPDGNRVVFGNVRDDGSFSIAWHRADGSGDTHVLWSVPNGTVPTSFHPGGKFLAFAELDTATSFDVKILPLAEDGAGNWKAGTAIPLVASAAVEVEPMFSPDGRWLAYSSTASGRPEIYVRPFPGPGGTWQVSTSGGTYPTWSRSGSELLFATLDQRVMAVRYTTEGDAFRASPPRVWTDQRHRLLGPTITRSFDLHPDGKRLVFAKAADASATASDPVVMVFNFFDELRRRVPAR